MENSLDYDRKGYLSGLAGEAIHLGAHIIAIAGCFDAMTTSCHYCRAKTRRENRERWFGAGRFCPHCRERKCGSWSSSAFGGPRPPLPSGAVQMRALLSFVLEGK